MISQKFLVPAVAFIGAAIAQNNVCTESTVTINSQSDADALQNCQTVKGSIVVGSGAAPSIDLSGPGQVLGSITVNNATGLITLMSTTITSIGGTFGLNGLTLLSTLSFSELTSVGNITWLALPALDTLTFNTGVSKAGGIEISNTFLSTLNGINLMTVNTMDINNNKRLVEFSTQVGNITSSLNIAANSPSLTVDFPNLLWANDMTFRNISSLSIPSLSTVNDSLVFDESFIPSVSTPNLTTIGNLGKRTGSLTFVGNADLTNITFTGLKSIGGSLSIANNTDLTAISFPALTDVGGAIDMSGNFSQPSLGALNNVAGTMNIQSTATINCAPFQALSGNKVQGSVTCVSKSTDPQSIGSGGTSTTSGSGSSSSSKGAAMASYSLDSRTIGLSVVGGLLGLLV